jgi:hypothetical protein
VGEKEAIQRGALQLLHGAAAALVIVASVADRRGVRRCHDFEVLPAAFAAQVDFDNDAEQVADLVRQRPLRPSTHAVNGCFDLGVRNQKHRSLFDEVSQQ